VLQCVAVCCSVLQCVAEIHRSIHWRQHVYSTQDGVKLDKYMYIYIYTYEHIYIHNYMYTLHAKCCRVLLSVAVCCSMLQCVAMCCSYMYNLHTECGAVCCSVLQCVAVCCSVLQRVAAICTPYTPQREQRAPHR